MSSIGMVEIEEGDFEVNEDGVWCPSCGEIIAAAHNLHDGWEAPSECRTCGFPDNAEKMTEYFT